MQMTKKILSVVLAVMMVVSMMAVMGVVSASAYDTIGELDAAIRAGGTVVLDNDFTYNGSLYVPAGVTTELDLAGHKIQSVNKDAIYNDGTLTIKDSVGNGQVIAQEACVVTRYGGTTTINGKNTTTFTSKDNGVFMGNGTSGMGGCTWNIKQGVFNGNIQSAGYIACGIYAPNDDTWNISGGTFNITNGVGVCQRAGTVNITGGTFNVTGDGSLGKVGDSRVVVPTGTAVVYDSKANYPAQSAEDATTITGGTFNTEQDPIAMVKANDSDPDRVTVTGGTFVNDPGAYVDTSTAKVKYTNTAGKVTYKTNIDYSNVGSSGTYQLLDDITAGSRIAPGIFASNVVIDLNGHTLTSAATDQAFLFSRDGSASSHKSFTITDTSTNGGGKIVANNLSASVSSNMVVDVAGKYTDVTISNVTIESPACGVAMFGDSDSVTITNSTIKSTDSFALATNGADTKNGTITVTNSTLTSTNSVGVYLPGDADATFNNATVSGTTAMYVKGGTVDIDGGSYTATGAAADYTYKGNGCNPTGDAIVVENAGSSYKAGPADVTIANGATLASANNNALAAYTKNDNDAVEVALDNVTVPTAYGDANATFTFSNGAAVTNADTPAGYELQDNGNGSATVVYAPLNPLMKAAASINDGNHFGLNCDYLMGSLLGVQKKDYVAEAGITSDSHQENGDDLRFVAVLSTDIIQANDIDDYGFVLATVDNGKSLSSVGNKMNNLKAYGSNGEKTVSCLGTYNNVCGDAAYGNPTDGSTDYKYVTCAVNGLVRDGKKVVARFFVKKGGKVYYAKYSKDNYAGGYTGIIAGINASGAVY